MLFLLKRHWQTALFGLAVLSVLGIPLRLLLPAPTPLHLSATALAQAGVVLLVVLFSDALIHGALLWLFGEPYRRRHRQLAETFRGQTWPAILAGSAMAGVGEELLFRGLGVAPLYLGVSAVIFGLLHHLGRDLWPFTVWAAWQGLLFAAALWWTGNLAVTMAAHFLHDLIGFTLFRYLSWRNPIV